MAIEIIATTTFGTPIGDLRNPEKADKPYRPSNGTAGAIFRTILCGSCALYDYVPGAGEDCTLGHAFAALTHDVDDLAYPQEWRHDGNGNPTCTAWSDSDATPRNARDERVRYERTVRDLE